MLLWLSRLQAHPAYLTHLLPAQLLGGAGVGLTIPSLLAAGSASLPPDRFGTGSGVLNMARQVGTVLGVAGLVAILAHVDRSDPLATYQHGLVLIIAFFAAAGVVAAILLTARTIRRPASSARAASSVSPAPSASEEPAVEVVGR
jgi:MFS family permease